MLDRQTSNIVRTIQCVPERDCFGATSRRSAHGLFGVLVRPGGVVGLLPCVVVAVAWWSERVVVVVVRCRCGYDVSGGGTGVAGGTIVAVAPVVGTVVGAASGRRWEPSYRTSMTGWVEEPFGRPTSCSVTRRTGGVTGRGLSPPRPSAGGAVVRCWGFVTALGSGSAGVQPWARPAGLLLIRIR